MEIRSVAAADARSLRRGLPAHVDDEHPLALHVAGFEDGRAVGIVSGVPVGPEGQKDGTWLQVYGRCGEQGAALVDALAARVPSEVVALWAPEPEPTLAQRGNRWERRLRYTEADIQVLEGLDAIRKRPGMYVGSCGARGVENLLWEPVSNAIDEHLLGHVTRLEVQLGPEGITVRDDGRGIPPEALEVVFGRLHAGSYRGEPRKHVHVGLHGVGLPVVTALSSVVVATTDRGRRSQQTYVQGRAVTPVVEVGPAPTPGFSVWFVPDVGIFEPPTPDVERVRARLAELAVLNPRLRIVLNGAELPSHGGLEGYARHLAGADSSLGGREVVDGVEVEFAVAHGAGHAVTQGWANQLPCVGSHVAGLHDALGRDEPGRVALVAVTLDHLAYAGRTRERLEVEGVRAIVRDVVRRACP